MLSGIANSKWKVVKNLGQRLQAHHWRPGNLHLGMQCMRNPLLKTP
jgi:hypothetical protein